MKLKIGVATICLVSAPAWSQSSVTLYGVVDTGLTFNSNANGHQQYALTSGNEGGSRFGFRGVEDLGGGLSAIFVLEGGFVATTGAMAQNNTFLGRQASVGVSSTSFGQVTAGRQYTTIYDYVNAYAAGSVWAAAGAGYGAHPGDLDNLDTFNRANNSVKFTSKAVGGFSVGAMYAFGNQAGSLSRNSIWSVGGSYTQGPLSAGVGYQSTRQPNFSFFGNRTGDSATANNITSPVIAGYATAGMQDIVAAGLSYLIGNITLALVYTNTRFRDLGTVAVSGLSGAAAQYRGTATFNNYEASVRYALSPDLMLGIAYDYMRGGGVNGNGSATYNQVDAGIDYFLSRRTDLYLVGVYQRASGVDSTGRSAVAAITGATPSSHNNQTVATIGIRHRF